jgi:plasmid replication initiation protein|tara:strand:+ start:273 stop:995 length:723 start_codon:yes stop_codon:yes gene_type:complete
MTELVKTESNLKATQDNQLIEACYTMTLNEKRLLLFGISKINPSTFPDVNKPFKFEMTAKEWTEHFGDDNPWRSLKRAGKKLMGRTLTLHSKTTDSNAPDETMLNWFEEAKFHNNKGRVVITFTRSVQVRLAGMLEQFTTIDLLAVSRLTSTHAVRLYELLSQFKSTGYRVMALDDFRFAMDVVNTNKGTKELKRAVLNPAIKQLNEKSDLFCIVQDIKEGRTITGFKFVFRTQEQKKLF